jgi:hypothetical protein
MGAVVVTEHKILKGQTDRFGSKPVQPVDRSFRNRYHPQVVPFGRPYLLSTLPRLAYGDTLPVEVDVLPAKRQNLPAA